MTFQDAERLDPDASPGELDAGRWVPVTRNTWRHGEVVAGITAMLVLWARTNKGFSVATGPGTKLGRDPDVLRGPDVGVVRRERIPAGKGADGWLDGGPDLAIEVLGDTQTVAEAMTKGLQYLGGGSQRVWLVDPEARRVVVLSPPNAVRVCAEDDTLEGEDVLPGFACRVAELFGDVAVQK